VAVGCVERGSTRRQIVLGGKNWSDSSMPVFLARSARHLTASSYQQRPAPIGRIADDRLLMDLRTVTPGEPREVAPRTADENV
jgi:hypothetical protein